MGPGALVPFQAGLHIARIITPYGATKLFVFRVAWVALAAEEVCGQTSLCRCRKVTVFALEFFVRYPVRILSASFQMNRQVEFFHAGVTAEFTTVLFGRRVGVGRTDPFVLMFVCRSP